MRSVVTKVTFSIPFVVAAFVLHTPDGVKAQSATRSIQLQSLGSASFRTSGATTDPSVLDDYTRHADEEVNKAIPALSYAPARVPAAHVPHPASIPLAAGNPGLFGFDGLSHRDQRLAGTGAF